MITKTADLTEADRQALAARLVANEVVHCVSALVSTMSAAYGHSLPQDVGDLAEQAAELCTSVEDWEEAARQAGWTDSGDRLGITRNKTTDERAADADSDEPGVSPILYAERWEDACTLDGLDPFEWEIYEHWVVSQWLGKRLEAEGERVDFDFGGLVVWGRTCSGQAIALDRVIQRIAAAAYSG